MRNNEYSYSDGFSGVGGSGQPSTVVAPTFIQPNPTGATYGAPFMGGYGGGFGFGGDGALGAILVGSLLGGRGLGHHGGDCGGNDNNCIQTVLGANILSGLSDISAAVPLAGLQVQNSILEQTSAISNQINQSSLAQLAATSGVKDAVQNGVTGILLNANQNTQSVLNAICGLSSKIDQNLISQLQTELAEQRGSSRSRDIEINVAQNVNQQQLALQNQQQFGTLLSAFANLAGDIQAVKQGQVIFNSGTMAASGTQAAANTKVA